MRNVIYVTDSKNELLLPSASFIFVLRILSEKKHCQIKLQRLQKVQIWTFGSLVHQINSLEEVLKLKKIFSKK